MSNNQKIISIGIIGIVCMAFIFFLAANKGTFSGVSTQVYDYNFFTATTTTATSTNATTSYGDISNAKRVTFFFQRGDTTGQGNTGTSTFYVQVASKDSPAESDWIYYNKLIDNIANTNAQQLTRLGKIVLTASSNVAVDGTKYGGATSTIALPMDLTNEVYKRVRCIVNEGTDGEHSCRAFVNY